MQYSKFRQIRPFFLAVSGVVFIAQIGAAGFASATATDADEFLVVDCLLPGQVRKLGSNMTYLSPRRAIRTSAVDCEIRGGEYVAYDRADYSTALKVWLPKAQEGDPAAMTNVGEIYEKGLGLAPDYEVAAFWYNKAAELDFARAQINLGYLHEMGLGVERNPRKALDWYRKASGVESEIDLGPTSAPVAVALQGESPEVTKLEAELAKLQEESTRLRSELDQAHTVLAESSKRPQPATAEKIIVKPDPRTAQELGEVQQTLVKREQEVKELDALLSQTRRQLAETQQSLTRHQQDVDKSQQKIQQTESVANSKQAELEALAAELKKKEVAISTATEKEKQALAELQQRETTLTKLEQELTKRRQEVGTSAARIKELQAKVVELEAARAQKGLEKTTQIASAEGLMVGPEVTLIEPQLPLVRGEEPLILRSAVSARQVVGRITAPAGLLSLTVNQKVTKVNPQGVFASEVILAGPKNPISIVAIDNQGKRAGIDFAFEYNPSGPVAPVEEPQKKGISPAFRTIKFGKYHALIIGNNDYQGLPDLNTPASDAESLADVLQRRYGVEATVLLDANRYQILSALNEMREKLTSEDNLLIYYAGHGVLDEVNMRGHWLPVDAEADNTANWISNTSITDMLNVIPAKQILVISDSCYSGSLTRSGTGRLGVGRTDNERLNWVRTMSSKRARMVMTSGGLEPVLDAGGGEHSVFSKALLEVLENNQDILEGQRLHKEVAAKVAYAAAEVGFDQLPEYAPIRFAGHESGEFFLVPQS